MFRLAYEEKEFLSKVIVSIDHRAIEKFLFETVLRYCLKIVEEKSAGYNVSGYKKLFVAKIYTHTLVGFFINWLYSGMKEDPEKLVKNLQSTLFGTMRISLGIDR